MHTFHIEGNGDTSTIDKFGGGYILLKVSGEFGGATIEPHVDFGDNDFQPLILNNEIQDFTIEGVAFIMPLKAGARLRFHTRSATGPVNVYVKVL